VDAIRESSRNLREKNHGKDRGALHSHRHVPTHPEDAAEVIVFASQLLRIVDRLKP